MTGISVVLCCYNSAERLPETLRHLLQQSFVEYHLWEVIVINNNSNDDTSTVAKAYLDTYFYPAGISYKVVDEPQPGLTAARERGFKESKFSYILFCDDDNWLCSTYLQKVYAFIASHPNEKIGAIGGFGEPVGEVGLPSWFKYFESWYATGPQSETNGDITYKRPTVFGAASVLNKAAYYKLKNQGFRSFLTGRLGSKLSSGEDIELCMSLALMGYKIFYFSDLQFRHYLNAKRLTKGYISRMSREGAYSSAKILPYTYLWRNVRREPKHFTILYLSSIHVFRLPKLLKKYLASLFKKDADKTFLCKTSLLDELNFWKAKIVMRKEIKEQYFSLAKEAWITADQQFHTYSTLSLQKAGIAV